ncbi:CDP-diacylglycerol--glycerol-3-phosphate 3-phosphatidyltransferase [Microlunatus elymi]|uniref:CDP-diacylglycerol--glycerol-3-phosphate 3-phosphatidyltransferase n=1 Tax=Microlunatus elymi TaxID=2596828 RepID=A0A516Q1D1_9ACTN|nr:CDP-diacylglycerol--glycerol-3-phosphate 3-phosphatidyltransferase [Microlunatus elymi]QDP97208.1 CDP-diacylglycerol--glycerol-3-phosphate 3-phosphatidyltransferase [Microlunatus elymi]
MTSPAQPQTESSAWNIPNALTAFRLVLVPVFAYVLLSHPHDPWWRVASALIFVVAIFTDFLDGHLARKHNIVTTFGKLADPIADKALTGMAFIGLSIIGELWWWVTIVILVREWGITLLRFVVLRYGVMAARKGGKIKTVLQALALGLLLLPLPHWLLPVGWAVMAVAFVVTVVTGVDYLLEANRMRRVATRPTAEGDRYETPQSGTGQPRPAENDTEDGGPEHGGPDQTGTDR